MRITDKTKQAGSRQYSKDGYLIVPATLSKLGIFEYLPHELGLTDTHTVKKVKRSEKSLFTDETLRSFEGVPITYGHPQEDVTAENWKALAVGNVRNVKRDGEYLIGQAWIYDQSAIEAIEKYGIQELSCGYSCEAVPIQDKEAEFEFTPMIGNHVALVANGRCGGSCKLADEETTKMTTVNKLLESILSPFGIKLTDEQIKQLDSAKGDKEATKHSTGEKSSADPSKETSKEADKDEKADDEQDKKADKKPAEKSTSKADEAMSEAVRLQAENQALKTELAKVKDELQTMKATHEKAQALQDAKSVFKSASFADSDSVREIQAKSILSVQLCDEATLKGFSDEAVASLYAVAKKLIQDQSGMAIGQALMKDAQTTIVNDLNRYKETSK